MDEGGFWHRFHARTARKFYPAAALLAALFAAGPALADTIYKYEPVPVAQTSERASRLDAADAEVRAARQALDAAKARLEQCAKPLAGERSATAFGTSRLNDGYFARQQALQAEVDRAQARLDAAYRARNDAK